MWTTRRVATFRTALETIARANPRYLESLYREYRRDPSSVDERWALVFAGYDLAGTARARTRAAPSRGPRIWPTPIAS